MIPTPMQPTPQEWSAIITALSLIITALAGLITAIFVQARNARAAAEKSKAETEVLLRSLRDTQQKTLDQVANTHDINLRDDLDRHWEILQQISQSQANMRTIQDDQGKTIDRTALDVSQVRTELEGVRRNVTEVDSRGNRTHGEIFERIHSLEESHYG